MRYIRRTAIVIFALISVVFGTLAGQRVYRQAQRAIALERSGVTRGVFLDRRGIPLIISTRAFPEKRRIAIPSLRPYIGTGSSKHGWTELEAKYSASLDNLSARRDWRTLFLHIQGKAVQGERVRLTIDARLQRDADKALGHRTGAMVVIQPNTGAILALTSHPVPCSLGRQSPSRTSGSRKCSPDRALATLSPPGSTFKVITLSAALDSGAYTLSSLFTGADAFGPSPYFDNVLYGVSLPSALSAITLAQAFAYSDNYAFARVGLSLGAATLLRYARRFYVGRRIPFDLPVTVSTVARQNKSPDAATLAQAAFGGEGDLATPLQDALIAASIANHGVLMRPRLVADIETVTGRVVKRIPPHALVRVVSRRTAHQVLEATRQVVTVGTGRLARIRGVDIAGKTGTAATRSVPDTWFMAIARTRRQSLVVVALDQASGEASTQAVPLVRRFLLNALRKNPHR